MICKHRFFKINYVVVAYFVGLDTNIVFVFLDITICKVSEQSLIVYVRYDTGAEY